jgi:hypothetical protein
MSLRTRGCPARGSRAASGGGALSLRARRLEVNGIIRADGADGIEECAGGGGGGTISAEVDAFEGAGLLSARGGASHCWNYSVSGSGAGGLVRVAFARSSYLGQFSTQAGGVAHNSGLPGMVGSVLLVDRQSGAAQVAEGEYWLRGGERFHAIGPGDGATLRIIGAATVALPVLAPRGALVILDSEHALRNLTLAPTLAGWLRVDANVDSSLDLLVDGTGTLEVNRRFTLASLDTRAGARITHGPQVTAMELVATRRLRIAEGAAVDAAGLGLPPGQSIDPLSLHTTLGASRGNGGSHGGLGGLATSAGARPPIYDDPEAPRLPGGGGSEDSATGATDHSGGGVVRLRAALLQVDGVVSADGRASAHTYQGMGSGAGGTLVVEAGTLSGNGALLARGGIGRGATPLGGGGGGLIHLAYGTKTFAGGISVAGAPGRAPGEAGKVVERVVDLAPRVVSAPPTVAAVGQRFAYAPYASGSAPAQWALNAGPAGASVDSTSGLVTWTPQSLGLASFSLSVSNAFGADTQDFAIEVVDEPAGNGGVRAPRFVSTADTSARCGVPYRYSGAGRPQVEGSGPLTFTLEPLLGVPLPPSLSVDADSGELRWTPTRAEAGANPLSLVATNAAGVARQEFAVVVSCPEPIGFGSSCGCLGSGPGSGPDATAGASGTAFAALALLGLLRGRVARPGRARLTSRASRLGMWPHQSSRPTEDARNPDASRSVLGGE